MTACGVGTCGTDEGQAQAGHLIASAFAPPLTSNPYGDHESRDGLLVAHSLRADGFDASEDGTGRGTPLVPVAFQCHGNNVGPMGTLRKGDGGITSGVPFLPVAYTVQAAFSEGNGPHARVAGVSKCLDSHGGNPDCNNGGTLVAMRWAVRRLTPVETERLQGFPDNWTLVPYRGKPAADGNRYKAVGNSMAVNCMGWIGQGISEVETIGA